MLILLGACLLGSAVPAAATAARKPVVRFSLQTASTGEDATRVVADARASSGRGGRIVRYRWQLDGRRLSGCRGRACVFRVVRTGTHRIMLTVTTNRRRVAAASRLLRIRKDKPSGNKTSTTSIPTPPPPPPSSGSTSTAAPPPASGDAPPPPPGPQSTTRPVGSPPLSDADAAARVRRWSWEPRPENDAANHRVPTADELQAFHSANEAAYAGSVTGNFTGTTDEIIQWAAWKWGVDEDVLRAQAVQESWWRQSTVGDNGESWGLFQIRYVYYPGTHPLSAQSTAFNADYWGAVLRECFDGRETWLNDVERGQDYAAGDLWGCLGRWYSGRWYTAAAQNYIASVQNLLAERRWAQPGF